VTPRLRGRLAWGLAVLALALALDAATAGTVSRAEPVSVVPLPGWVRSVESVDDAVVVWAAPRVGAPRRGTLERGVRSPALARVPGDGCAGSFIQIGETAFVCERYLSPSAEPPSTVQDLPLAPAGLPGEYAFTIRDGVRAYARPEDLEADQYADALGKGFAVRVSGVSSHGRVELARTAHGLYVRRRELRPAVQSAFEGLPIDDPAELARIGWVVSDRAVLRDAAGQVLKKLPRLSAVRIQREVAAEGKHPAELELDDGTRITAAEVRRPAPAAPPADLGPDERWIDVDRQRQVLIVYAGTRPVFTTLVSTGRARDSTPAGEHRVWVKLLRSDMNDAQPLELWREYSLQEVPWVQYFAEDVGLHAAFWHERFGEPVSHGCVNLSPLDARRLFELSAPALPPGWSAVLPPAARPGTRVRVR